MMPVFNIFWKLYLDSSAHNPLCHPKHTFGYLLVVVAAIQHPHWIHASISAENIC